MSPTAAKRARAEAMLGELAELNLKVARELATQISATEDPEQQAVLVTAFQKTSRSLRLILALDAKLDRQAAQDAREAARAAADDEVRQRRLEAEAEPPPSPNPRTIRKNRVRTLLDRLLWTEAEGDEDDHERLRDELATRLDMAFEVEGFDDLPIAEVCRVIATDMGLSGALTLTAAYPPSRPVSPPLTADTG